MAIVRVVVPLAAAAQVGTCMVCGSALPWFRFCDRHAARHRADDETEALLEANAEHICGLTAPRGWSR